MKSKAAIKIIFATFLLIVTLTLCAGAGSYQYTLEKYPAGDLDHDGVVSASDARNILRVAVGLQRLSDTEFMLADANGDGRISSDDSRKALRVSVKLEEPHFHTYERINANTFRCTGCASTYTDTECAHNYALSMVTTQPTCSSPGTRHLTCIYCGAVKTETLPPLASHQYDGGYVTKAATCAAAGVRTYTCRMCGAVRTETIPKLSAHTYDGGRVTKAATCAAAGVKTYTCRVCGAARTETIPKLSSHTYDDGCVTKAATCAAAGVRTYTCRVCGVKKNVSLAKLTTHTYGTGRITTPATCTTDGVRTCVCTVCGASKTEKIDRTGHSFETITADVLRCSVCGYTRIGEKAGIFSIDIGQKTVFIGEKLTALVDDFGAYTRADNNFLGLTAYSFTKDYSKYFIAFVNGGQAVGYYVCASDFSSQAYSKGSPSTYVTKRCNDNAVIVTPYCDRVNGKGVYAILAMSNIYNLLPDTNSETFFTQTSRQIFDITNAYRVQNGASVLRWDQDVADVARRHSEEMAAENYLEHTDKRGREPWQRADAAGFDYVFFSENIAGGSEYSYLTVDQWINSKSHNAGLLSYCSVLGVGGAGNKNSEFVYYWTQNFEEPA